MRLGGLVGAGVQRRDGHIGRLVFQASDAERSIPVGSRMVKAAPDRAVLMLSRRAGYFK